MIRAGWYDNAAMGYQGCHPDFLYFIKLRCYSSPMFEQLLTPAYAVFAASFVLMIGIGLVEAVGLGIGHFDLDLEIGEPDGWVVLDWLGFRSGLPILVWVTSLLGCFTLTGLAIQQAAEAVFGVAMPWVVAVPVALMAGFVANAFASGMVARFMPEFETTVVDREALLRRRATVLEGEARRGAPARAKVVDQHGQAHYVMVEPHDDGDTLGQGESGLLVRQDGPLFFIIPDRETRLAAIQ